VGSGLSSEAVVPLGPNRSLHLVRAGSELVLLGVAEQGVTPIRSYTQAEAEAVGLLVAEDDFVEAPASAGPAPRTGPMTIGQLVTKLREKTVRS
jgi:flagellar protein FliO/FliZ